MALSERIALKSKGGIIELTPSKEIRTINPSPSKDSYFDSKENIKDIEVGIAQATEGKYTIYNTPEMINKSAASPKVK